MKQGVPAFHYDCSSLKLLAQCHLDGKYGFIGTSTKETVVKLEDADEIRANLPLQGASIAGKLGGSLERGSTLDLALVMVGQRATTWDNPVASDLRGACTGATHFLRSAHIGAFAMSTGTKGKVAATVEIFGAGGGGESSSTRDVQSRDGDLDACKQASPDAPSPPGQCSAPVRLELFAIAPGPVTSPAIASTTEPQLPDDGCAKGLVLSAGKCTKPGDQAFLCDPHNGPQCQQQCDKGSADSCYALGLLCLGGGGGVAKDPVLSSKAFKSACDGGSMPGCLYLGYNATNFDHDDARAFALKKQACEGGSARACAVLGWAYNEGKGTPKDPAMGLRMATRACDGGDAPGCGDVGTMLTGSYGLPRDIPRAVDAFERSCHAGLWGGCSSAAGRLLMGDGVAKDAARATTMLQQVCDGHPYTCETLARVDEVGLGVPANPAAAFALYDKDCTARTQSTQPWMNANRGSCAARAIMLAQGRGTTKDAAGAAAAMQAQCAAEAKPGGPGCVALAQLMQTGLGVPKDTDKALAMLGDMCGPAHTVVLACQALGITYYDGVGVPKDVEKAREPLKRGCVRFLSENTDPEVCRRFDSLPPKP
jgi:TPR repeat protein